MRSLQIYAACKGFSPSRTFFLFLGVSLVVLGAPGLVEGQSGSVPNFDDADIRMAAGILLRMVEGAFGALVMVVAGLLSIVAAAFGGYRASLSMLVVAIGAFILRSLVSLFFGPDFPSPHGVPYL